MLSLLFTSIGAFINEMLMYTAKAIIKTMVSSCMTY